jgi:hypothetical protein
VGRVAGLLAGAGAAAGLDELCKLEALLQRHNSAERLDLYRRLDGLSG